jgi:hypothetical protein
MNTFQIYDLLLAFFMNSYNIKNIIGHLVFDTKETTNVYSFGKVHQPPDFS